MVIKQLSASDIHPGMLDYFNRYQKVDQCWRKRDDNWIQEDASYIRDWDEDKKGGMIHYFSQCIEQGGMMSGVFDENKMIGFAITGGKLCGSLNQYINLCIIHISSEYRGKGIGSKLFAVACKQAADLHAKKLYISAHAAKDTIAFYEKMGCQDALETIPDFIDAPDDRQLEYVLPSYTSSYFD